MALPKINHTVFEIKIPSTGKNQKFRPYVVKEEKILLLAQESSSETNIEIVNAIKQIINNCCIDANFDSSKLSTFDIEYIFIKLRAMSVDNIVEVSYRDGEDDKVYDFKINLNDIEVTFDPENEKFKKINIHEDLGMTLKFPASSITDRMTGEESEQELLTLFVINCIDEIFTKDDVFVSSECTEEELSDFVDSLPVNTFKSIKEFVETMPTLSYTINYKNSLGNDRVIKMSSLKDFFTWG